MLQREPESRGSPSSQGPMRGPRPQIPLTLDVLRDTPAPSQTQALQAAGLLLHPISRAPHTPAAAGHRSLQGRALGSAQKSTTPPLLAHGLDSHSPRKSRPSCACTTSPSGRRRVRPPRQGRSPHPQSQPHSCVLTLTLSRVPLPLAFQLPHPPTCVHPGCLHPFPIAQGQAP